MRRRERGFSLIELLIVVAIILIIAALAVPNLLRARVSANEASAVNSIRTMTTACVTYNSTYGEFPPLQADLGPSNTATPSSTEADLLDQVLGSSTAVKSGYTFTYVAGSGPVVSTYTINADPVSQNQTGIRHLYTDQSGLIRSNSTAVASVTDSPVN